MKRRKAKIFIIIAAVLVCICFAVNGIRSSERDEGYSEKQVLKEEIYGFLDFTYFSEEEWKEKLDKKLHDKITYGDVEEEILTTLNLTEFVIMPEGGKKAKITREDWIFVYDQIVDLLDTEGLVEKKTSVILSADGTQIFTENGAFFYEGKEDTFSLYQNYELYYYEDRVLGTAGESEAEAVLEDGFITEVSEEAIRVLFRNRGFSFDAATEAVLEEGVCDLTFSGGKLTGILQKKDELTGNLLQIDGEEMEISDTGKIRRKAYLPVYQIYGDVVQKNIGDIVIGNMDVSYVVADNEVCAVLLTKPAELKNVRVLLLNEEGGNFREDVLLISDVTFFCSWDGQERTYAPGEIFRASDYGDATVTLREEDGVSPFYLCDETGNRTTPGYRGELEIRNSANGYVLVNNVDIETYLYSVVPSEMPSSYEMEALKAQAVCARSYVARQMTTASYPEYGAHIDDSTAFQVYNRQETTDSVKAAVDQTAGLVLKNQGTVIEAYYYSTSCGFSETDMIWNPTSQTASDYLKCQELSETPSYTDLSSEETFREFILSEAASGYDSFGKYYRWTAEISLADKEQEISEILETRNTISDKDVAFYDKKGDETDSAKEFGKLTGIEVRKRDTGGAVMELDLQYKKGTVKLYSEYNIRKVLAAGTTKVTLKDGSELTEVALLPSAFICMNEGGETCSYQVSGGGYGHGVGMSQNGAQGMAQKGYDFTRILNFFYQNIQIEQM